MAREYCRPGCGQCLNACPVGLPIDDILRYAMYYDGYRSEQVAIAKYARLPAAVRGEACLSCAAPCQGACPFDLPIRAKVVRAQRSLRA